MSYKKAVHYMQQELRKLLIEDLERDIQTTKEYYFKNGTWDSPERFDYFARLTKNLERLYKDKDAYMLLPSDEPIIQDRFSQAPKMKPTQAYPHR